MTSGVTGKIAEATPFISVVTVSFNAAGTIGDTLASVALQETDFSIEHVCVDGGSTDDTRSIIDRWAGKSAGIATPIYEPDEGIFDAMNKGLRAARGEYVLFLNADDFLVAPDSLAIATAGLAPGAPDNPDVIAGDVAMGWLGSRGVWRHRRAPRSLGRLRGVGLFPVHPAQFTRRVILESVGGFDAGKKLGSDVIQYYDLERKMRLSVCIVARDITYMRPGGSANANLSAMKLGTSEIFHHLRQVRGSIRAAVMVTVKTLQSVGELRYGVCPHTRWFSEAACARHLAE